ncbi:tripartite motif-containing protein 3-like isoform X1 [Biomphalaria pfeifferi]|uniref:Tripartite motif-containing protein 3-like isoform X1 n=1 Tax=Biomphalaria pfeifferi TaxID=112525 RepID=A0AAD8AWG1_BIOPF|nr:tripartite motif-containing protein 3-like isoform X1 [Biomphalaria pfeifferi]
MAVSTGISDELICSICLDFFNTPILLPCAHTFCKQCLINVSERSTLRRQQSSQGGESEEKLPPTIFCPNCRLEVKLGLEGINGLPRNTSLANIILSVKESRPAETLLCEVCDNDPARVASKICADCSLTYCLSCFRQLHPMRGTLKYHVIKDPGRSAMPVTRCLSPVFDSRSSRLTPAKDSYGTDTESGDESGTYVNQDKVESIRRQIKNKKKELNNAMKTVQNLLKTVEEETEERMREVRSICSHINECVGEREAALLTILNQQRHESVKQCLSLSSEVKAQTLTLELLEDKVNDVLSVNALQPGSDVINDITSLQEKVAAIQSRALTMKAKLIPRQPKFGEVEVTKYVATLDFVRENKLTSPVFTEFHYRPVTGGPALVEIKWKAIKNANKIILSARTKDAKGLDISTSVELPGSMTSYVMALPWGDTEYHLTLEASTDDVLIKYPTIGRNLRTLPYIHCFKARFNPATCHKKIAVLSGRDEIVHRKCKMANLNNACQITTSFQRLDTLEGAMADEGLPLLPHIYWESILYFHVFGKLGDSKLLCDVGVCKHGSENDSALLCDNTKACCAYLVRRSNKIALEFWNGFNSETLPRSIPVLDLNQETEKTVKLGFYFDAMKRLFAIVSPGNNAILCQIHMKYTGVIPLCGLYCFDQVFGMIKFTEPQKLPNVLCKLIKGNTV